MSDIRIVEEYAGLSRQQLLDRVYELGYNFTKNAGSCSQSTVAALHELLGFDELLVRGATSLCGGSAVQYLGTCGALAGGVIVLDYYLGRPLAKMSYEEHIQSNFDCLKRSFEAPKLLADKFVGKYGSILCPHIERRLFGRSYYGSDPDESRKHKEAQELFAPNNCFGVVGDVARWVMEILLSKGVVESKQP